MKIKRLEITGFKSFADKVVLDFQQGVTGVVGPNGCGKSNIVDAIRWCMGEQSAKNLRGKAMEDVIFAGSDSRKSLGMAEVSLVFSTEDGRAPARYLEFSEIQLTRRLYRDGESDYLINKTPCRLMDITEIFMDTGVGTKAYSIIEQGKIGQILHSRPEERRLLIEEAAGVTKFKVRKQLALKKIEGTRHNLARLADVIGEIRRQLAALQRQAKKAEKFRECREELREIDIMFAVKAASTLHQDREQAERDLAVLNDRMREMSGAGAVAEAQVEERRLALVDSEHSLAAVQEYSYKVRSDSAAKENSLSFMRKEQASLVERIARLDAEAASLKSAREELLASQTGLEQQYLESSSRFAAAAEQLAVDQSALVELESGFEAAGRGLELKRKELLELQGVSAKSAARADAANSRILLLKERSERHRRELQQLKIRVAEIESGREALSLTLQKKGAEREMAEQSLSALAGEEQRLSALLPEAEKLWQGRRDELSAVSSRLKSLQELEVALAGYGQGVQALLKDSPLKSVFNGFLADSIEVPEKYEAAVEAALSDRLQLILCNGHQEIIDAIDYLKNKGAGRAQLAIPLEFTATGLTVDGAVPLLSFVKVAPDAKGLVSRLLADIHVVDGLPDGLELASRYPSKQFVSLGGELVSFGGVVSGGATEAVDFGIMQKKREIRTLEGRVNELLQEVDSFQDERDRIRQALERVAKELLVARSSLHSLELELAGFQKDLQQVESESARINERLRVHSAETLAIEEEGAGLEAELKNASDVMESSAASVQELEHACRAISAELEGRRVTLAANRENVTALRVTVATLKEHGESLQRAISIGTNRILDLAGRIEQATLESGVSGKGLQEISTKISEEEEALKSLLLAQVEVDESLKAARDKYEESGVFLAAAEAAARSRREENEAVRKSQSELTLRFSSLNLQLEHLEQSLHDRHRCSIAEAEARLSGRELEESDARKRQVELEQHLEELGEVNLMAIDEYAAMEERFNFLSSQKSDLEESLKDLQQAIQKINRTTRKRFLETFSLINGKFQEVFPRLFCGGKAELRLTDEQDLLETGIDIIVQPPGKKLANVMLMSGGEKALTAVALIFSIFLIKPTPFCLLDEVDAPLDDANIGRFNDMVREMSAISQFIIITHNKTTMAVADTLYGVTMEEPGASRLVSVRLN